MILVSQESAYKAIFEACEEGIVVVDPEGHIIVANRAALRMFGYSSEEMTQMEIERLIPERFRQHHVHLRSGFHQDPIPRKMGRGRDLLGLKKDGTEFALEASLSSVELAGQVHIATFMIDITARKEMESVLIKNEEQLAQYASELEQRVKRRTIELEKEVETRKKAEEETNIALKKERELNELKSRFVTMASHEFRTPLSTILSSTALIERYSTVRESDKEKRHLKKIKSAIANLNGILNDFLSLSKLEEGKIIPNFRSVPLHQLLQNVIDEMHPIKKKNQEILTSLSTDTLEIVTDEHLLKNILINLISNALKYSRESGTVHFRMEVEDDQVVISVEDQGIGIPEEEQKHLFERFFRAKNALNIQGTGLGLNIVKNYTEILGGSLHFESAVDEGSTFTLKLPKRQK